MTIHINTDRDGKASYLPTDIKGVLVIYQILCSLAVISQDISCKMPRVSRARLRLRSSMSRKASAYQERRRTGRESESERRRERGGTPPVAAMSTTPDHPSTSFFTCSTFFQGSSTSSQGSSTSFIGPSTSSCLSPTNPDDQPSSSENQDTISGTVLRRESSASLRTRLLAQILPSMPPVTYENSVISKVALEKIGKLAKCSVCSEQCEVSLQQKFFDAEYKVQCGVCGELMFDWAKESVKTEGHRRGLGPHSLSLVYFCMQHDLGYAGMRSLATSLGVPLMCENIFQLHERRLEDLAKDKYMEYSNYVIEAVFYYYKSELNILPEF